VTPRKTEKDRGKLFRTLESNKSDLQFHDQARDMLLNPTVIVEVLSPSTEAFDRGRSFAALGPGCQRS
jgi:hypothetical protein